jgi:antitoxin component YwqK of YwqJK toxin-antitoxin module
MAKVVRTYYDDDNDDNDDNEDKTELKEEYFEIDGKKEGIYKKYIHKNKLNCVCNYVNNKLNGECKYY